MKDLPHKEGCPHSGTALLLNKIICAGDDKGKKEKEDGA